MDPPESSKPTNTNCEDTHQDSPAFRYMSDLSPLPPVEAPSLAPRFQGLNSPPPVFALPKLKPRSHPTFLKSKQVSTTSVTELPGSDADGKNTRPEKGSDSNGPVTDLINSPTGCLQQSSTDIVNVASIDPNFSFKSTIEESEDSEQPPDAGSKEILVNPECKQNPRTSAGIAIVPPVITEQIEENIAAGEAASLDDPSHLFSGSIEAGNENEKILASTAATLAEPVLNKDQNDPEAFRHHGLHRRLQFKDAERELIPNQPAQNPSDIEGPESLSVEITEILINRELDELIHPSGDEGNCTDKDGGLEEFYMPSPQIEWQLPKSLDSSDGDFFIRCHCKKSKCLKRYCDCFAATVYCVEFCYCQECSNRHEYEDKVREAREKVESRNPLAFDPKVVQPSSRRKEDGSTPSSTRHRRGCRCRKLMCLKKNCRCFESFVGCSDRCCCVGCKNIFGQRKETVERSSLYGGANTVQDDTPKILKGSFTPFSTVKGRSPNKKRASPPLASHEFGSSSSTGRRARIVTSPFPPPAPCLDSKTVVDDQANDPEKQSDSESDQNL